jgi:GTP-binding protein
MTATKVVEASFVASAVSGNLLPAPTMAEVAFGGRSNVGKSSLLNAVMQRRKLVRAGGTPGTTRAINVFAARTADGLGVHLVDLPGYGYSRVSKREAAGWGPLVEGYIRTRVTLRAVAIVVDVRRGLESDDAELVEFVRRESGAAQRPALDVILVATKVDKIALSARKPALRRIAAEVGASPIAFSAVTGEGADAIWQALRATICRTS